MRATLNRVSLVTEVDIPYRKPDRRYFEDPAHFDVELSRALLHEATHYWQQLASAGLLVLAGEDWKRLLKFERSGIVDNQAPLRAAFGARHATEGFSIQDLVECTSRYWEILNMGPHNLVEAELARGVILEPEVRAMYESTVAAGLFRTSSDGFTQDTVSLAMHVCGGSYARLYFLLEDRIGDFAMILFPLLSHWALQTKDPVRLYGKFTLHAGAEIARSLKPSRWRRFLRRDDEVTLRDMDEYQDSLYLKLRPLISQVAKKEGTRLLTAGESLAATPLANHPVYAWAVRWIWELGRAALEDGLGDDVKRHYRGEAQAWVTADRMLALPGGPYLTWLYRYLRPPIHRFSDDKTWFTGVEPVNQDNIKISEQCIVIHTAWKNFRRARRGH
jgi:hypothetical protein